MAEDTKTDDVEVEPVFVTVDPDENPEQGEIHGVSPEYAFNLYGDKNAANNLKKDQLAAAKEDESSEEGGSSEGGKAEEPKTPTTPAPPK